jgi:DNA-binding beta-propeller fold protein YncE
MNIIVLLLLLSCKGRPDTTHLEKDVLSLQAKITLPGVRGRIDHLAYDSMRRRLFVAALGNNTVEVVDLAARERVHSITGLHEPQGVAYLPALGRLVVANGGNGVCVFYTGDTYTELGSVALGDDADNVRSYGAKVYVGYGSGGIAVIDPAAMQKVGNLSLQAHPESFQLGDSGRVYINVPDAGAVVSADLAAGQVDATWENRGASANFPMALDSRGGRVFVGYRHSAQLRVLDARTGMVLASMPCVGDADDIFYDAVTGLVFVSGGEGYVDVFRGNKLINRLATRKGARTCLWLSGERKLIVAVPARGGEEAELWVYGIHDSSYPNPRP